MSFKVTRLLVPTWYCIPKLRSVSPNQVGLLFLIYVLLVVSLIRLGCLENGLLNSELPKITGHLRASEQQPIKFTAKSRQGSLGKSGLS
ncbi:hypothetical protein T03_7219 [Trichinella britovi]|uniref:Uncharacterized protein n=1 Tax=Trichinella britovi TaxID=45882 RepID=A0A0V1CL15_TRIBR|nr:hypothetical protein T03_7219 [Trichinella britovi]